MSIYYFQSMGSREFTQGKHIKRIGILIGVLYGTWTPALIMFGVNTIPSRTTAAIITKEALTELSKVILVLSFVLNPVVYHRCSGTFNKAFKRLLCPAKVRSQAREAAMACYVNSSDSRTVTSEIQSTEELSHSSYGNT